MKKRYPVKHNGVWYASVDDIPKEEPAEKQDTFSKMMNPPEKVVEEEPVKEETPAITRTDIARMNKAELISTAKAYGIEGADEMTGAEIKKALILALDL